MAEPVRKPRADIEPDIRPNLRLVKNLEENPNQPTDQGAAEGESSPRSNVIQGPWKGSGQDAGWDTNVTPTATKEKITAKAFLKSKGPLGAIVALLLGGGIFAGLALPSLLLIHVQEMMMERFDVQNTSMTIRANRVLANKLTSQATQGVCGTKMTIACKFQRPSNKLLNNLAKNGITAFNGDPFNGGSQIDSKKGLFPNTRPTHYVFKDDLGYDIKIEAKDFPKAMREDPRMTRAFFRAYNPRMVGVADSVFRLIQNRFGFSKTNKLAGAKNAEEVNERIKNGAKGSDTGARRAAATGGKVAESFVSDLVRQYSSKMFNNLRLAGKGSLVSLISGAGCLATNIPQVIIGVARAYQISQLVRYAMNIATPTSAQKAGSSSFTPEIASSLGSLVMSSINSFGMRYTLFGDTNTNGSDYKNAIAGASVASVLGGTNQVTQSGEVKGICDVATNPATGTAINASLVLGSGASLGTTALIAGANYLGGEAISWLLGALMPAAIDFGMWIIEPHIDEVLGLLMGDFTENMTDEEAGAAYAGGMAHMLGETANAGGNVPMTVDQAVGYKEATREVQLAYAEVDRATLSPFDATNKNTFLGSIVNSFLPYYAQLNTASGVLKTIASIPLVSIQKLVSPVATAAEDPSAEYTMCDDPAIKDGGVAAGPFCNLVYGIPTEYLNLDPQFVVDSLVASGEINEDTGEPIDKESSEGGVLSLHGWTQLCLDGTTDQAANCALNVEDKDTERRLAMYAIYTIDHRIQKTMDEEELGGSAAAGVDGLAIPAGEGYRVTSGFGPRPPCPEQGNVCSTWHRGTDFAGGNMAVMSMLSGIVLSIGAGDINNRVIIDHGNGLKSHYLHMRDEDITVSVGEAVTAGQVIGKMGSVGQSTGTHLHFEIEADDTYEGFTRSPDGTRIDSAQFFQQNGVEL